MKKLNTESIFVGVTGNGHWLHEGGMIRVLHEISAWNKHCFNVQLEHGDIMYYLGYYENMSTFDLLFIHHKHGLTHLWYDEIINHSVDVLQN